MLARLAVAALALTTLAACSDHSTPTAPSATLQPSFSRSGDDDQHDDGSGAVFVSTNDATANAVIAFTRHSNGTLTKSSTYSTGGRGVGGTTDPLTSQFALTLSENAQTLFVVNAGSNEVTSFAVHGSTLTSRSRVTSGGTFPVSVASGHRALYVLNAQSNTIGVIPVSERGVLAAAPTQTVSLQAGALGATAVRLSRDGRYLSVTERASNTIDSYRVDEDGRLRALATTTSAGSTPFGFDYTPRGQLIVSEAGVGSVSSYGRARRGALQVATSALVTGQRATCWLIVDNAGRFAYTANAGSANISGVAIGQDGTLALSPATGIGADLGTGAQPLDLDLSRDSRFLYVIKNGTGTVGVLRTNGDGTLTPLADAPGLAIRAGYMGLAAY